MVTTYQLPKNGTFISLLSLSAYQREPEIPPTSSPERNSALNVACAAHGRIECLHRCASTNHSVHIQRYPLLEPRHVAIKIITHNWSELVTVVIYHLGNNEAPLAPNPSSALFPHSQLPLPISTFILVALITHVSRHMALILLNT